MGGRFSRWTRQILAEILDVYQENLMKADAKKPSQTVCNVYESSF